MSNIYYYAIFVAILAFLWTNVLTMPDHAFDFVRKAYLKRFGERHPKLFNVLIDCPLCFGGQICLWSYPLVSYFHLPTKYDPFSVYDPGEHFIVVVLTIASAFVILNVGMILKHTRDILKEVAG
jgi:hypothetical protein